MPSLAKHNYVSCLMQITLPEIDNYTLYYETFVFILRVYAIMLFDYVYRCAQSSARTICTPEDNYKPANERHAKRRKEKERKEERYIRAHIPKRQLLQRYYDKERPVFARPPGPNRIKSSFARLAPTKNSKLLILIRARGEKKKEAIVTRPAGTVVMLRQSRRLQVACTSLS